MCGKEETCVGLYACNVNEKEGTLNEFVKEAAMALNSKPQPEDSEAKDRVETMWEQMNKGIPKNALRQFSSSKTSAPNKTSAKASNARLTDRGEGFKCCGEWNQPEGSVRALDKGISIATLKSVLNEHNSTLDTTFSQKISNSVIGYN
ncbi:uncharacterized protein LOC111279113 [Durio zibethinus]|uniref:Uncharacterized protein LOC111279113 n=1 Tax=Durio zibethinus TaxID=66656 RepID=A0A6P5X0P6_DURZI|nr:uncharacterized protein LOC111279113 [Durio zibethinus]